MEPKSTAPVRLQVLLDASDAERFERYCAEFGFKKSTLVARLIREHLDREGYPDQGQLFSRKMGAMR